MAAAGQGPSAAEGALNVHSRSEEPALSLPVLGREQVSPRVTEGALKKDPFRPVLSPWRVRPSPSGL